MWFFLSCPYCLDFYAYLLLLNGSLHLLIGFVPLLYFLLFIPDDSWHLYGPGCMADRLKTVALPTSCQLSQPCFMSQSPAAQKICSTWVNTRQYEFIYLFIFILSFSQGQRHLMVKVVPGPTWRPPWPKTKKKITHNNLKFYIYLPLKKILGTSWIFFFYANKIKIWSIIWAT